MAETTNPAARSPLMATYWTVSRPGRGPHGARVEPVRLAPTAVPRPQGRLRRDRHLARRPRAPARDAHARGDAARSSTTHGLEYLEVEFLMDWFFDPEGEPERADSDRPRKLLFDAAAALGAHHIKVGNIPGTPCELDQLDRALRRALRRRRAAHQRADRLRVHAVRRQRSHARRGARGRRRRGPPRTAGSRSTPGTAASSASRPRTCAQIPGEYLGLGRASRRPVENMDDPIDEVVNHRAPARRGRVRHPRLRRGLPGDRLRGPVGRRGPLRGAAQPADRGDLSSGPTRRRRRSSAPA